MKKIIIFLLFINFAQAQQKTFSEAALSDVFLSENGKEISFSNILQQYKGKTVFYRRLGQLVQGLYCWYA